LALTQRLRAVADRESPCRVWARRKEARVARGIVEGMTIDEIAARYRVERETIRTQVKAVLDKTGTRRQVEVASLLAGLPSFPAARSEC
jgi:DNA-binding CsgD family transcriptional regulator